jgi:hypothetical protein
VHCDAPAREGNISASPANLFLKPYFKSVLPKVPATKTFGTREADVIHSGVFRSHSASAISISSSTFTN